MLRITAVYEGFSCWVHFFYIYLVSACMDLYKPSLFFFFSYFFLRGMNVNYGI